jgi:hypothetical protein
MSKFTKCGLPAAVQVSGPLTLPWLVPAPLGGEQVFAGPIGGGICDGGGRFWTGAASAAWPANPPSRLAITTTVLMALEFPCIRIRFSLRPWLLLIESLITL